MNIAKLKELNEKNGGHYFEDEMMERCGEKLSDYEILKFDENTVTVRYKKNENYIVIFCAKTGRVASPEI